MINPTQFIRNLFNRNRPIPEAIQAIENASLAGQKRMTVRFVSEYYGDEIEGIQSYIIKKHKPDCIFFFIYPSHEDYDNSNPATRARWIKPNTQSAKSQRKWNNDAGYYQSEGIEYTPIRRYEWMKNLLGYANG